MSKSEQLEYGLALVGAHLKGMLNLLRESYIRCDAFSAGFSPNKGFYVHLAGNEFRGEEGEFLRASEVIRLEILFRKFRGVK